MIGQMLGPYRILEKLGEGGMGEVYKARDTRLDRSVAIKVLPPDVSGDPERRARFEREAKTVAGLNHAHICTLHDVGDHEGAMFLVMEHLVGQTLAERLEKGPLPLEQALTIATEIADALSAAHRHGVIHRDLKPANVILTKAGAKLLDFGLAKLTGHGEQPAATYAVSAVPTQAATLTGQGVIVGTLQYMAPEQLEGKPPDARTDLWALGAILYEMVTGKPPFQGSSPASLMGAILERDPAPLASLQRLAPPVLGRLVHGCLAKDPDARWQTATDVKQMLAWVAEAPAPASVVTRANRLREWAAWALAAALGFTVLFLVFVSFGQAGDPPAVVRFDVPAPEGTQLRFYLALSPPGRHLAFTAQGEDGVDRLYVRSFETGRSDPIAGTEGAIQPFWSPDGRSVGFFAGGKLKAVEIGGGAPRIICSVSELRGATWNPDGTIVFGAAAGYGLRRVAATGGTPAPVTQLETRRGDTSHRWPYFLPDGRHFLYVAVAATGGSIWLGSLDDSQPLRLLEAISAPVYALPGYLLFVRDGALRAQAFSPANGRLRGEPITVAEPVGIDKTMWGGAPVSIGGPVLAYRRGDINATQLTWFDRQGRELGVVGTPGEYLEPALSPDGTRVVAGTRDFTQLAMVNVNTGVATPFTFKTELVTAPCWSHDGRSIAYGSNRHGAFEIFLAPAAGGGGDDIVAREGTCNGFSPDGRFLLYQRNDAETQFDVWVVPTSGDRVPRAFVQTAANESNASFSPDGRWVAYSSDSSGRAEVYVKAFPGGEGPWQVSIDGGDQAQWGPDGRELFYLSPGRRIMAVQVTHAGLVFKPSTPRALFRARMRTAGLAAIRNDYVVSPDGQRFLINKLVEDPTRTTITVAVNWASGLK